MASSRTWPRWPAGSPRAATTSSSSPPTAAADLPKRERIDGYTVRRFRAFPAGRDWYFSPGLFWAALRTRYDVVHVQGIHTLVPPLAMLAAILRRTPFLLTFHTGGNSSAFREKARRTQFRILSPLLRRARTLVGVSVFEARRFEEIMRLPEGAITVIRNGGSLPPVSEAVDARARPGGQRGPDRALQGPPQGDRGAALPAQDPPGGPGGDPRRRTVRGRAARPGRGAGRRRPGHASGSSPRWTAR